MVFKDRLNRPARALLVLVAAIAIIPVMSLGPAAAQQPSGTFGDLKDRCGPGDASGATARGVTNDSIKVTTMADPGNSFSPGLGQEYFDTAEAFVKWCNDAGGILGRKIELTTRDAKGT